MNNNYNPNYQYDNYWKITKSFDEPDHEQENNGNQDIKKNNSKQKLNFLLNIARRYWWILLLLLLLIILLIYFVTNNKDETNDSTITVNGKTKTVSYVPETYDYDSTKSNQIIDTPIISPTTSKEESGNQTGCMNEEFTKTNIQNEKLNSEFVSKLNLTQFPINEAESYGEPLHSNIFDKNTILKIDKGALIYGCFSIGGGSPFKGQNINEKDTIIPRIYYKDDLGNDSLITFAHELLHYEFRFNLPNKSLEFQDRVYSELLNVYNVNKKLRQRMQVYLNGSSKEATKTTDENFINELHSIVPTEVREIGHFLEDYYKIYFNDRKAIQALNN